MGRVRVFYGHEGVVPPTGLRSRSAAAPAPVVEDAEVDVVETIPGTEDAAPVEIVGELVDEADADAADDADAALPDDSWSGPELDEYAEEHGIDLTGAKKTKATKLARILESVKEA